ncbi:MAG: ATP-binding cassette domain-containing protein, partial [Ilumatobacteraceae bacterium]
MALLDVRNVSVRFGGVVALDDLSFTIDEGEICGLIGPNGAGKTTLFNVVSRIYEPQSGELTFDGDDLLRVQAHGIAGRGVARTFQNLALFPRLSVLENVMVGAHSTSKVNFLTAPFR